MNEKQIELKTHSSENNWRSFHLDNKNEIKKKNDVRKCHSLLM